VEDGHYGLQDSYFQYSRARDLGISYPDKLETE
jgi:hypothetical protein